MERCFSHNVEACAMFVIRDWERCAELHCELHSKWREQPALPASRSTTARQQSATAYGDAARSAAPSSSRMRHHQGVFQD